MSKTKLTRYIEQSFLATFPFLTNEHQQGRCRCDLGGTFDGMSYGIEVKTSVADMNTGYGLNQEKYDFGYLAVPKRLVKYAIGHLHINGYYKTGVIAVDEKNNSYQVVKNAMFNPKELKHPALYFITASVIEVRK